MKILMLVLVSGFLSTAQADQRPVEVQNVTAYSKDALELLSVAAKCPQELVQLLQGDGRIKSATHTANEDQDLYTVEFVAGGWAPTFHTYSVGSLKVTRVFQKSNINAPDAPGGDWIYTCEVVEPGPELE